MIRTSTHHETDDVINGGEPTVFIVDENPEARRSLVDLIRSWGYRAEAFESAEGCLGAYDPARPGCVVAHDRLPGMSGLAMLARIRTKGLHLPVVLVADDPDVRLAVHSMQQGAVALLHRVAHPQELHDSIRRGLRLNEEARALHWRQRQMQRRLSRLSPTELEVLELMISGKANKNIARHQAVSLRTVETRRQQIFQKMEADSLAELILMVVQARTGQALPDSLVAEQPLSRHE